MKDMVERLAKTSAGGGRGGLTGITGNNQRQLRELEQMIKIFKKSGAALSAYEKYMLGAARREKATLEARMTAEEKAAQATRDHTDSVDDDTDALDQHSRVTTRASEETKRFVKGVVEGTLSFKALTRAVEEVQHSYRLGFKWDPVMDALNGALMGMDPKTMMEFQAQFRRTSGAMAGGIDQFNNLVRENQQEMIQYTGSMKAAAFAMGNMYDISHNIGLNLNDVADSADGLFEQFKKMQAATSMTIDQFNDLARSMTGDADVRSKLLSLQKDQRSAYIRGLIAQTDHLQAMGMQKEAAEALVKYTESASNKNPIERMQQGAKMGMISQVLGGFTGEQGRRLNALHNKRHKSEEELKEYQTMMKSLNDAINLRSNTGQEINGVKTGEIMVNRILDRAGLTEHFAAFNDASLQSSASRDPIALSIQNNELQERQTDLLQQILKQASIITDQFGSWGQTALATVAGAAVAMLLNKKGGIVDSVIQRGVQKANGGPNGGGRWGKLATGLGGVAGRAPLALAGTIFGGMIADAAFDPSKAAPENARNTTYANGALQGAITGAGAGAMLGPWGALVGGLAGAGMGLWQAYSDFQGDYHKQAQETFAITGKMMTAEQAKIEIQRKARENELRMLESRVTLTKEESDRIIQLKRELKGLDGAKNVADLKQTALAHNTAANFITRMNSGDNRFTDTADLNTRVQHLQSMTGMAGLKTNAVDTLVNEIIRRGASSGLSDESMVAGLDIENALRTGKSVDIPKEWIPIITDSMVATQKSLVDMIGADMATIRANTDPEVLSKAAVSSVNDTVTAEMEAARKKEIADKAMQEAQMDMSGHQMGRALQLQKEAEQAAAQAQASREAAQALSRSASGEAPLTMKMDDDQYEKFAKAMSKAIKSSTRVSSAKPTVLQ